MITSLDLNFEIPDSMLGIVVERKNPAPKEGESLQLFIPILMPNLNKTIPVKLTNFINKGSKLFLNDISCRPKSKVLIKTQNYLTGYLEKNSEWINASTSEIKNRALENSDGYNISATGTTSEGDQVFINLYEVYKTYYTIGGEKVDCYAPNGKLSKLLFNNEKYL